MLAMALVLAFLLGGGGPASSGLEGLGGALRFRGGEGGYGIGGCRSLEGWAGCLAEDLVTRGDMGIF